MRSSGAAARWLFVLVLPLSLSGCLASDTIIKVKADGSGTLEQIMLVNPKSFDKMAMAAQMAGGQPNATPGAMPSAKELLSEARLKEAAARFGGGVRYVSSEPLTRGDMEGARAIFAFDDINALNVSQTPSSGTKPVTFHMEKQPGGGSRLTVTMPEPGKSASDAGANAPATPPQLPPEALSVIQSLMKGLHISMAIDVQGTLVETNADFVEGTRVTLIDVDFDRLLSDPAIFQKLAGLGAHATLDDLKPVVKDVPGAKINSTQTVTIELK